MVDPVIVTEDVPETVEEGVCDALAVIVPDKLADPEPVPETVLVCELEVVPVDDHV